MAGRGWKGAVRLAVVLAGVPVAGSAASPVLRELRLVRLQDGFAAELALSTAVVPAVAPVLGSGGRLERLHVDLPPGTRLAPGVPRVVQGAPPLRRARLGVLPGGRLRLVLDVAGAARFVVRTAEREHRVSVVVSRRPAAVTDAPTATATTRTARAARRTVAPRPLPVRPLRVVLDAGHGGDDPGAVGYVVEKHVTLDVVRRLARRLREDLPAEVILTRSSDATVPLTERTAIANQARADLFVSIHANAHRGRRRKGIETYVLDDTDDQATLRLAAIENGTGREPYRAAPTDLRLILSSLVQGGKMPESSRLAHAVQAEVVRHLRARYAEVEDLGVKRGPFYVLVGSHIPCILVETSFVTHPMEGKRLAAEAYRAALADGLARGIRRFLVERRQARTL